MSEHTVVNGESTLQAAVSPREPSWLTPLDGSGNLKEPGGCLVSSPGSRLRSLRGLAEDFRCGGRACPRLWHILHWSEDAAIPLESFSVLSGRAVEHDRGDWPVLSSWGESPQCLVGMFFGDDVGGDGLRRFEQLARTADTWVSGDRPAHGPGDPVLRWIMYLYRLARAGLRPIRAERRRRCAMEDSTNTITLPVAAWADPKRMNPVIALCAPRAGAALAAWYAILEPDVWTASALAVESLPEAAEPSVQGWESEWRPARWFFDVTQKQLTNDHLRKARERDSVRVTAARRGKLWHYQVGSVIDRFPHHAQTIRDAIVVAKPD